MLARRIDVSDDASDTRFDFERRNEGKRPDNWRSAIAAARGNRQASTKSAPAPDVCYDCLRQLASLGQLNSLIPKAYNRYDTKIIFSENIVRRNLR
jgi:hypothetical protein